MYFFERHTMIHEMSDLPFWSSTEKYDEKSATAHVRRLLDIVACTTSFGSSGKKEDSGKNVVSKKLPTEKNSSKDVSVDGEIGNSSPSISSFYEFFSLSHVTPPLQCQLSLSINRCTMCFNSYYVLMDVVNDNAVIRRLERQQKDGTFADHLFSLQVRVYLFLVLTTCVLRWNSFCRV